jgi:polysaccharide deacetylase family protein (PEP-CTERM system associated)
MGFSPHAPPNAFTVDLEDWFQGLTSTNPQVERWPSFESRVVSATHVLLKILHEYGVQATFFVLGYVADQHPLLIREIREAGHEIASHGYYHRFVHKMSPDEFLQDLAAANEAIERAAGLYPTGFRAPYFSVNASTPWVFEYLAAAGFRYDASVFPTRSMLYGFPGAPRFPYRVEGPGLVEFPASTIKVGNVSVPISGGFYMRLFPYPFVRRAIRAIMYFHPWELDLGQDYPHVTARERITHYFGRRGLETKLRRLLSDFRFTTLGALMCEVDEWSPGARSEDAIAAPGAPSVSQALC